MVDLREYSYYLTYIDSTGNIFGNASGFLLKKEGKSFLISNIHVLFGIHVADLTPQKEIEKYGNFKISLRHRALDGEWVLFDTEFDLHRQTFSKLLIPRMLDLFSYRLPSLPKEGLFYHINDDFELDLKPECDNIVAYGYPAKDHLTAPEYQNRTCKPTSGNSLGSAKVDGRRINTNLRIEKGMSGCPIFTIRKKVEKEEVKFYGIGDGYDPEKDEAFITRFAGSDSFRKYFD